MITLSGANSNVYKDRYTYKFVYYKLFCFDFSSESPDDIALEIKLVEKNMELEIKDIELNSQKKKYECLLLKVRHLNQEVEFKSIHISELENEINNLNQKWKSNSRTKARVSELETEIKNLRQKLKSADEKAKEDQIRMELQLKTIENQESELKHQRFTLLKLREENKCLSQKQRSFQSSQKKQELQQQEIKKKNIYLEIQKISSSNVISSDSSHSKVNLDDANSAHLNSRKSEKPHNQLMEDKDTYPANIINELKTKTEEVLIIDLTENLSEENQPGLFDNNVISKDEFIEHISEMTNAIEFKNDKEIAQISTILSKSVEKNPNQSKKVARKSLKVIHPKKTSKRHISKSKKEDKSRLNKESPVFKSTSADKNKSITKVNKHKCKICSKGYVSNFALAIHMDGVHKKIKPHKCPICLKGFTQSGHMRDHVNVVHKKFRRFKCTICSKDFATNYFLKTHVNTFHKTMNP
jgi:hypothetical protein